MTQEEKRSIEYYYKAPPGVNPQYTLSQDWRKAGEIIGTAFYPNKFNQLITEHCSLEENVKEYQERVEHVMQNNTLCLQSDDYSAVALWTPPEWRIVPYSIDLHGHFEFSEDEFKRCADKFFVNYGIPYWHLTLVAKNVNSNTKGSVSKVMKPILEDAKERGIPAALECIDERARQIYEHYGFKTYEIIKIGEGSVNSLGEEQEGGEGLTLWYMIYNYDDKEHKPLDV